MIYSAFSTYSCITYYEFFKLSKLLGGGGGAKRYVCPPIFSLGGGGDCPPPPRIDASVGSNKLSSYFSLLSKRKKWSGFSLYLSLNALITSFGGIIEWTGQDSTHWVVNFHSTGVRIEWNSLLNEWNLFTIQSIFREYFLIIIWLKHSNFY